MSGTRRVISLCFLLALVVLLMQKAREPKYVRNAFEALGVPLDQRVERQYGDTHSLSNPATSQSEASESTAPDQTASSRWRQTCDDLIPRLLASSNPEQLEQLCHRWFAVETFPGAPRLPEAESLDGTLPEALRLLRMETREKLQSIEQQVAASNRAGEGRPAATEADSDVAAIDAWRDSLEQFGEQWELLWRLLAAREADDQTLAAGEADHQAAGGHQTIGESLDGDFSQRLTNYLDSRLLQTLQDATPWRPAEQTVFFRFLQRGDAGNPFNATIQSAPLISTQQLEGEADIYRGQTIRFRGSIRRVDWITRESDSQLNHEFGLPDGYWSMWLRGADGSSQPVAVYTTYKLDESLLSAVNSERYPEVEIAGCVGKRLAYSAQSGVEVAPTLFASSITHFAELRPGVPHPSDADLLANFGLAVLFGLLAAGAVLVPILVHWNRRSAQPPRRSTGGGRGQASSQTGSEPRGTQRSDSLVILLAGWLTLTSSAIAQNVAPEQERPPWAESPGSASDAQPDAAALRRELLAQRLRAAYPADGFQQPESLLAEPATAPESMPEPLLKTLHVLRQFDWPSRGLDAEFHVELEDGMASLRPLQVRGWVTDLWPVRLTEAQQDWYQRTDEDHVWQVQLEPEETANDGAAEQPRDPLIVYCSDVPALWIDRDVVRQPVRISGMGLYQLAGGRGADARQSDVETGRSQTSSAGRWLCGFTHRPLWVLPSDVDTTALRPKLPARLLRLAEAGWDLSQLDTLIGRNQRELRNDESEAFFSLVKLGATVLGEADPEMYTANPVQVLADPRQAFGEPLRWRVRIVTGSRVSLAKPEDQRLLGKEFYYQYDGMVDIGNRVVRYRGKASDAEPIEFEGEFPITIVSMQPAAFDRGQQVAEPGAGQTPALAQGATELDEPSAARSWNVGKYASVTGIFYRLWSYESTLTQRRNDLQRQAAPLVIAASIETTQAPRGRTHEPIGWFAYALCLATLVFLSAIIYLVVSGSGRRRRHRP